jgi:tRNA threonylcarbamoyl adenosine modification protein YeaZ
MRVLALDTATEACSVAVLTENGAVDMFKEVGRGHAEEILRMVDGTLAKAGITLGSLDGIAASVGPGSFTGVRISVSVAQGLAFGAGLPVIAVSTLEALAVQAMRRGVAAAGPEGAAGADDLARLKQGAAAGANDTVQLKQGAAAGANDTVRQKQGAAAGADDAARPKQRAAAGADDTARPKQGAAAAIGAARALGSGPVRRVLACLDARMGEIYWGCFQADEEHGLMACGSPTVGTASDVRVPFGGEFYGIGRGFAAYPVLGALPGLVLPPGAGDALPEARDMAWLGALRLAAGAGMDAADLTPLYLRDKVALTEAERAAALSKSPK